MNIYDWSLAISVVSAIVWAEISLFLYTEKRWPRLYSNTIRGVTILVNPRDYRRGRVIPNTSFRLVTPAFVFYRKEAVAIPSIWCTGDSDVYWSLQGDMAPEIRKDIFVPFISETQMDFRRQRELFPPSTAEQARAYLVTPSQEAVKRIIRNSRNFWHRYDLGLWLAVALVALFLAGVFGNLFVTDRELRAKPITFTTVYRTHNEFAAIRISKPQKIGEFPPVRDSELTYGLAKAVLTEDPIYMGGGVVSARVHFAREERTADGAVRASSALNLRKGDAVIIRYGEVMFSDGFYSTERWVVGKGEAEALLKSGLGFKLNRE